MMENGIEMSSSLGSCLSNGSSSPNNITPSTPPEHLDNLSLNKLSSSLEKLLIDSTEYDYSDAEIVVEGIPVGVHRCVLASRSLFFHELFKKGSVDEGKPKYLMSELVPYGKVGYEAFNDLLNYLYTAKLKPPPPEVSTCVDEACVHDACRPAISYVIELMYASAIFQMKELVSLLQRRLLNFVEKAFVEDVIPILMAAYHCQLNQLLSHCIQRIVRSDLESACLERELPPDVYSEIKSLRSKSLQESEGNIGEVDSIHERRIRKIHKALDSDDIELLKLLLNESNVTLNDACALHYAAAYCDPKVVKELLSLDLASPNLRNTRGHTVLHVAARRKEPSTLVALLNKGACASETTLDGQTAVAICRRMTRPKDYNENIERCKESHKDKMCIDILKGEMRRSSMSGTMSMSTSSEVPADDLHMKLEYLEDRVKFAQMLFPAEAKLAMDIADAHSTSSYTGSSRLNGSSGNFKEVDLNEKPSERAKRIQLRMQALRKTVETGRRFFPHCSEVIDKILDDDMPDALLLENGTPEEQKIKKMRFTEIKDEVQKAFSKDMAEKNNRSSLTSSSSSSSSPKEGAKYKVRKR